MGLRLKNPEDVLRSRPGTQRRDLGLATFRIAVASYWLYEQHWKLPPDFGLRQPRGLMFAFQQGIQYPTLDIYKSFLETIVVPNFYLFGWLLFIAEVLIGLSLLLGLFTRAGAIMATIQALNLLISQASTPEGLWIYLAILLANLIVLLTPTNRQLSLDRVLAPTFAEQASRGRRLARVALALM
jgi:thiosulfate dehydrogenase [quinone] large subunit